MDNAIIKALFNSLNQSRGYDLNLMNSRLNEAAQLDKLFVNTSPNDYQEGLINDLYSELKGGKAYNIIDLGEPSNMSFLEPDAEMNNYLTDPSVYSRDGLSNLLNKYNGDVGGLYFNLTGDDPSITPPGYELDDPNLLELLEHLNKNRRY